MNIYKFIVSFTVEHIYPPTVREIAEGCGITSTATVWRLLHNLESDGLIEISGKRRGIKLLGYEVRKVEN